jgi:hypothetical protein
MPYPIPGARRSAAGRPPAAERIQVKVVSEAPRGGKGQSSPSASTSMPKAQEAPLRAQAVPVAQGPPMMPQQTTTTTVMVTTVDAAQHKNIDVTDLTLVYATMCCNTALYVAADCCGCSSKSTCCCCESESCLKIGGNLGCGCNGNPDDVCVCRCCCYSCGLVSPSTCCLGQSQCCCLVSSAALPPNEDVPCMCTLCCPGLVVCPKVGCCMNIGDITGKASAGESTTVVTQTTTGYQAMAATDMAR